MRIRRSLTIAGVASVATLAVAVPALAYWSANNSGSFPASATSLAAPTSVSASATSATAATVTWNNGSNPAGTTYTVSDGSSTYCSGSTSTASPCNVTGLTTGTTYTFTVTPVLQGWTGPAGSAQPVTPSKAGTSLSVTAPSTGTAGTAIAASGVTATLASGTAPTGSVTFTVFGPQTNAPTTCTSGGTAVGSSVTVSGNGSYHPSTSFTPSTAGNYWWYASYGGDSQNATAASSCGSAMAETVVSSGVVATPGAPALLAADDAGTSNSDGITNVQRPRYSGSGVTAGASITLYAGATAIGTTTATSTGSYTVAPTSNLADGTYVIKVTQTVNGTESAKSAAASPNLLLDSVAPANVAVTRVTESGKSGTGAANGTCGSVTASSTTSADASSVSVVIKSGSVTKETDSGTCTGGTWSAAYGSNLGLTAGTYSWTVTQTDVAGNTSTSAAFNFTEQ